jgi:ABC-2 type transport system permease protein
MALIQPIIWLSLFGKAFNLTGLFTIPEDLLNQLPPNITANIATFFNEAFNSIFGTSDYFSFMSAGMLSVIVLFTSMFSGMSIVWDRRLGFLNKLLVAPISRGSIVLGKVLYSVVRSLIQAALVFSIALGLGLRLGNSFVISDLVIIFGSLFLLSVGLSSVFIAISIRVKSMETQIAVVNLLNLPLLFASNALFPIKLMPSWLQTIASLNPISYASDAVRLSIFHSTKGLDISALTSDFIFLGIFALVFTTSGMILAERALRKG